MATSVDKVIDSTPPSDSWRAVLGDVLVGGLVVSGASWVALTGVASAIVIRKATRDRHQQEELAAARPAAIEDEQTGTQSAPQPREDAPEAPPSLPDDASPDPAPQSPPDPAPPAE